MILKTAMMSKQRATLCPRNLILKEEKYFDTFFSSWIFCLFFFSSCDSFNFLYYLELNRIFFALIIWVIPFVGFKKGEQEPHTETHGMALDRDRTLASTLGPEISHPTFQLRTLWMRHRFFTVDQYLLLRGLRKNSPALLGWWSA